MCVPFVHDFETKVCSVQDVSPGVNDLSFFRNNRLVKVETIEIESHSRNTKRCKPDAHHREGGEEEVQRAGVIERSILKNQSSKVSVSSDDVVRLFFLPKLISIVVADLFGCFTDETRSD